MSKAVQSAPELSFSGGEMRKVILMTIALLVGCATPNEIRKRPFSLKLTSSHSANRVAVCIAGRWADTTDFGPTAGYPIDTTPIDDGYSVSAYARNLFHTGTGALADIQGTPNGSTTRYFKSGLGTDERFDIGVKECQ
jgi:hypothetical protein